MEKSGRAVAITKQLSANDTGDTGGHQAGILVPKIARILSFFPPLDSSQKNPRHHLTFYDRSDAKWVFAFIYYNNAFFGGTRNEYRLTRMTAYIRENGLNPGDELLLRRDDQSGRYSINYKRARTLNWTPDRVLKLGTSWKEIKL